VITNAQLYALRSGIGFRTAHDGRALPVVEPEPKSIRKAITYGKLLLEAIATMAATDRNPILLRDAATWFHELCEATETAAFDYDQKNQHRPKRYPKTLPKGTPCAWGTTRRFTSTGTRWEGDVEYYLCGMCKRHAIQYRFRDGGHVDVSEVDWDAVRNTGFVRQLPLVYRELHGNGCDD